MNESKVLQLFPISVYQSKIDIDENTKSFLCSQEYERMATGNGDFTKNKYVLETTECSNIKKEIMNHLDIFTKKYLTVKDNVKFYMQNSWGVKHSNNDWGQPHMHGNSLLSGVCYLKTKKDSGNITFHKPDGYTNLFHSSTMILFDEWENHNSDHWSITPEDGDILIFPSHLMHGITKNNSNIDRYSLAFNFHVEGEMYSKDSKIDYLKLVKNEPNENR
tara:strand:+ start:320 stop:976 length:657 start_codon:yes stop_codon:yes gene_type:complete